MTMTVRMRQAFLLVVLVSFLALGEAFLAVSQQQQSLVPRSNNVPWMGQRCEQQGRQQQQQQQLQPYYASNTAWSTWSSTTTLAMGSGPNDAAQGTDRGLVLLALSFAVCVWIFSIPPEFRRATFCLTAQCTETRCNNCVTPGEWVDDVKAYYAGGGGIQWDFSVSQEAKDLWSGK